MPQSLRPVRLSDAETLVPHATEVLASSPLSTDRHQTQGDRLRAFLTQGHYHAVLDTDPYNEVDDQFALAYALLSPQQITLEACYAAPFHNERVSSPAEGMERSFTEIYRVLNHLPGRYAGPVLRGASDFLKPGAVPQPSPAALDLIARAMEDRPEPLVVIAIAAITNIATAILLEPRVAQRIVVVWLGGQPCSWHTAWEFNLRQDPIAARIVLDSGVAFVRIPCKVVAEKLLITPDSLRQRMPSHHPLNDFLCETVVSYLMERNEPAKVIWDISAIALLIQPAWIPMEIIPSPILNAQIQWESDPRRHPVAEAIDLDSEAIFADMFRKFAQLS